MRLTIEMHDPQGTILWEIGDKRIRLRLRLITMFVAWCKWCKMELSAKFAGPELHTPGPNPVEGETC